MQKHYIESSCSPEKEKSPSSPSHSGIRHRKPFDGLRPGREEMKLGRKKNYNTSISNNNVSQLSDL